MRFVDFTVRWIAGNLSIPFWMVGHVHLSTNVYQDIHEIVASMGMNIIVAIGFYLEWREHNNNKKS
jgi:hypothetical protein